MAQEVLEDDEKGNQGEARSALAEELMVNARPGGSGLDAGEGKQKVKLRRARK